MKLISFLLAVLTAFVLTTPAQSAARIEPLRADRRASDHSCTVDRIWCVTQRNGAAMVVHNGDGAPRHVASLPLPKDEDQRVESTLWPRIVRIAMPGQREAALLGVQRTQSEMYSGGGGSVTTLTLFEVGAGAANRQRPVFEAPLDSSFMIRACFTPEDQRRRRDACHDEYRYHADLTAPPQRADELRLVYNAQADSFPGRRNRFDDSSREGQLRKSDLVRAVDRRCTFERQVTRDPRSGVLRWNAPLPDCREYLELQ